MVDSYREIDGYEYEYGYAYEIVTSKMTYKTLILKYLSIGN